MDMHEVELERRQLGNDDIDVVTASDDLTQWLPDVARRDGRDP